MKLGAIAVIFPWTAAVLSLTRIKSPSSCARRYYFKDEERGVETILKKNHPYSRRKGACGPLKGRKLSNNTMNSPTPNKFHFRDTF